MSDEPSAAVPAIEEGTFLWQPSAERVAAASITRYMRWLRETRGLGFDSYDRLWAWSVTEIEAFWGSIWDYFEVQAHRTDTRVLSDRRMPGARWFPGAEINYAEHALRRRDDHVALLSRSEGGRGAALTYRELHRQVSAAAAGMRRLGVGRGDRVVGYLPNVPEAVVAFLAAASIGAIWSCCSPDFGVPTVLDRFQQIRPRLLVAIDGYRYAGRDFDRRPEVEEIARRLPGLERTIIVSYLNGASSGRGSGNTLAWEELLREDEPLAFEAVPFDHPLWVLYSSGTTGLPKAIVQGHGGILLEHWKSLVLQMDLTAEDHFFWYTSTGWMMWNKLVSGLLLGTTVVLYDGSPGFPDLGALWRFAEEVGISYFGTSAPFLMSCRKAGIQPGKDSDLRRLTAIGSTGAPLPPEGFQWVYDTVKPDVWLGSVSGGTDLCTAFVGSCPLLPVRAGELQCRGLGAKVEAFDAAGKPLLGEVGELVLTEPLPSMPLFLWNDTDGRRYHESYFDVYPGVWRHGDWIKITEHGACVIYGRSDSTLNRAGVRTGTSEIYRVVEEVPDVVDSLAVDTTALGTEGKLLLFVVLRPEAELDDALSAQIAQAIAREISPRHVPDEIHAISAVPRTLNGKKLEVPVKRILAGVPLERAVSLDSVGNPETLAYFVELAPTLSS
ncbi:MAG: acetoacetate--CoA ligase [Chloroflexi bacterium]|nr:acetoacetate--CoA ligase [Chloroflexota bacterium]